MVKKRQKFNLPEPERNRTGTGNLFNLNMRSTVNIVEQEQRALKGAL